MARLLPVLALLLFTTAGAFADDKPKAASLTPKEIAEGWILLFDGETTFGWNSKADDLAGTKKPELSVKDGSLRIAGSGHKTVRCNTEFRELELELEYRAEKVASITLENRGVLVHYTMHPSEWKKFNVKWSRDGCECVNDGDKKSFKGDLSTSPFTLSLTLPQRAEATVELRNVKLRPINSNPLFNGKNIDGWKVFQGDPKRAATKFEVTKDGELSAKNGPGDLQTEKQFDDFVLQLECKTNGKYLNSGVFFRCIPDQYQNGYEAQIQNAYLQDDRTKPLDFGTGAIYRRIPARKVVSNDNEWFTMTLVAQGAHFATWVNGYQTVDWTDDRKANDNPRQGLRTAKGHLSIQGHDPTTDLLFRNIRIAELPKK